MPVVMTAAKPIIAPDFCGASVTAEHYQTAIDLVSRFPGLSRRELANTLCEWFEWERPNGKPKAQEATQWLETLAQQGLISLPPLKNRGAKGQHRGRIHYPQETQGQQGPSTINKRLAEVQPVTLLRLTQAEQQAKWREQVNRYHYLGATMPFGASIRYWIMSPEGCLGCMQFSSPAWRIKARDQWIGWNDTKRKARLQHIVCNSRFLIFPWVKVQNLASHVLSIAKTQLLLDWPKLYGVTPLLIETMVDPHYFQGTCYRAANYIHVGQTAGRGRQDQLNQRHGMAIKSVFLLPLTQRAVGQLLMD